MSKKLSTKERASLAALPALPAAVPFPVATSPMGSSTNSDVLDTPVANVVVRSTSRPKTALGISSGQFFRNDETAAENERLKGQLQEFSGASATKKIHPSHIRRSKWANRDETGLTDSNADFVALRTEIESAGGNVQPIKVRPIPGTSPQEYEVVFGHRRHKACLDLGLEVLAMIESLDEKALFIEMDRENRQRADLRPYEQGLMYKRALDQGLFSSLRKLAEETGADASNVSKAIKITELPEQVLNVFAARASVLDIQYGWSRQLHKLYKSDPDVLLARVKDIEDLPKINNYTAAGVYRMLIGKSPFSGDDRLMTALVALSTNSRTVDVGSQKYELVYNSEMTSVKLGRLNAAKLEKLEKFLSGLLKDD